MDWYYSDGIARNGPVSEESFAELVRTGVVTDSTLVWNVSLPEWRAYGMVRPQTAPPPMMMPPPTALAAVPVAAFCSQCGRRVSSADLVAIAGRQVCANCKPALLQQLREGTATVGGQNYAGFWIRFAAVLIDYIILSVFNVAVSMALVGTAAVSGDPTASAIAIGVVYLLSFAAALGYEAYFLVNKGATPGKMALGLRVVRASGGPITWGLAIGRHFSKYISGLILGVGYFMAGWDVEKRALHDRICDTRVIKG